jgi:nucleoid-associated protein YgaU
MKKTTIFILIILFAAGLCYGQSFLKDNADYKKAQEYQKLSEQAFDGGDYDKAYEYSELAKEYTKKAQATAEKMALKYKSNGLLQAVKEKLDSLTKSGANKKYKDDFDAAKDDYNKAKASYDKESYDESIGYSNDALAKLKGIEDTIANRGSNNIVPEGTHPKYYKVRKVPTNRDCFWNIAAYPFVYGDAKKWKILYQANKSKLKNPKNPSLIYPGQVFEIPSIEGEVREGTYAPD